MSSFNPDYSMTLGDLLGVDQQGNRITPVDESGNRRAPMTSPVGGGRNQALINRLEAAQKDTAAQLQQRVDRDRLTDLVETITFARASGIPLSELQGLIRRSDLEASGMVETAEARRRRRMEDKRKTATANRERAEKARAEFRERRAAKKSGIEERKRKATQKRRDDAMFDRMTPEERRDYMSGRLPFEHHGMAKPDMTPIDRAAEDRMMMEDVLDFGPTPDASGPVGEPRSRRDLGGAGVLRPRDLPEGFREQEGPRDTRPYTPPGMTLEDVDAFAANFGPNPRTATPSEQLAMRETSREDFERGRTRVAPGAVGSAPQNLIEGGVMGALFQQASPKSDQAREALGGMSQPYSPQALRNFAARQKRNFQQPGGFQDRAREFFGKPPRGMGPQSAVDLDQMEQSLRGEVDQLRKQDRVSNLMEQRNKLAGSIQNRQQRMGPSSFA